MLTYKVLDIKLIIGSYVYRAPTGAFMLTGKERFHSQGKELDGGVVDFLLASTNLLNNVTRGHLAEYIVRMALGLEDQVEQDWESYDIEMPNGCKIEVKSSAFLQSWPQPKPSTISFSIAPKQALIPGTAEYHPPAMRHADLYVFCLFKEKDKESADPCNLDQWEFLVLATQVLNEKCPKQKNIGINALRALEPSQCGYSELAPVIASICQQL